MDDLAMMADAGRGANGRFGPGNAVSRGNPHVRRMHVLRRAVLDAIDSDRLAKVVLKLLDLAEAGDVQAAKLVLEYSCGKPPQAVELSGPDGEPLGGDMGRLQAVLMEALRPFADARLAVALRLRELTNADAGHG